MFRRFIPYKDYLKSELGKCGIQSQLYISNSMQDKNPFVR